MPLIFIFSLLLADELLHLFNLCLDLYSLLSLFLLFNDNLVLHMLSYIIDPPGLLLAFFSRMVPLIFNLFEHMRTPVHLRVKRLDDFLSLF
jgi:hypothetical protein